MKTSMPTVGKYLIGVASILFVSCINMESQALEGCLPECGDPETGEVVRYLAIAGSGLSTIEGGATVVHINAPSSLQTGTDNIILRIFDGDAGAADIQNQKHADTSSGSPPIRFTLCADADEDGVCNNELLTVTSSVLQDNTWQAFPVPVVESARNSAGGFSFLLVVEPNIPLDMSEEDFFKMYPGRNSYALGVMNGVFGVRDQIFNFIAPLSNFPDVKKVYPDWDGSLMSFPNLSEQDPTFYDGTWKFYFLVMETTTMVANYDGEYDARMDDDDFNYSGIPPWACASALPEGIHPGNPADDSSISVLRRSPDVQYAIVDSMGRTYLNDSPSGDSEWEHFEVGTNSLSADIVTDLPLPPGIYQLIVRGLDLGNLVSNRLNILCVEPDGSPCTPVDCLKTGACGTGTPGYWQSHPENWPDWPDALNKGIMIGDTFYTQAEALLLIRSATAKDMRNHMFAALAAAKLNVMSYSDPSCIMETIIAADKWMADYGPIPGGTPVRAKDDIWQSEGASLRTRLDDYNNGLLCAPYGH